MAPGWLPKMPSVWPLNTRGSRPQEPSKANQIKFFGSQIGGQSVINYCYTDMPMKLLLWDTTYFFVFAWALPWIIWPVWPWEGGDFDELAPTRSNLWCIFIHIVLIVLQTAFLVTLPLALVFPLGLVLLGWTAFLALNWLLCRSLNASTITFTSDPKYAPELPEHEHEQWIFINGVAAG
jgi:hypothetical protein